MVDTLLGKCQNGACGSILDNLQLNNSLTRSNFRYFTFSRKNIKIRPSKKHLILPGEKVFYPAPLSPYGSTEFAIVFKVQFYNCSKGPYPEKRNNRDWCSCYITRTLSLSANLLLHIMRTLSLCATVLPHYEDPVPVCCCAATLRGPCPCVLLCCYIMRPLPLCATVPSQYKDPGCVLLAVTLWEFCDHLISLSTAACPRKLSTDFGVNSNKLAFWNSRILIELLHIPSHIN